MGVGPLASRGSVLSVPARPFAGEALCRVGEELVVG